MENDTFGTRSVMPRPGHCFEEMDLQYFAGEGFTHVALATPDVLTEEERRKAQMDSKWTKEQELRYQENYGLQPIATAIEVLRERIKENQETSLGSVGD